MRAAPTAEPVSATPLPDPAADLDDATLVARARDRDVGSFETLVRRYERRIYTLSLRMLGGANAEAQDITQETFLTAWRRLPDLESDDAFGAWLYRTATNRCLNLLRRRRPTAELDDDSAPSAGDAHGDPQRSAENRAAIAALTTALADLPDRQRACWLLREVHGRSYAEIAALVGASTASVRGRIARARAQLAEVMTPWQ